MTGSGNLGKIDGDIFYAYDIDTLIRSNLNAGILNFCNFQKTGVYAQTATFVSGPDLITGDYMFDGFYLTHYHQPTGTTLVVDNESISKYCSKSAWISKIYDNFNDSSFDSTRWTTGGSGTTVTENTECVTFSADEGGNKWIYSSGTNGLNLKTLSGNSEIIFHWVCASTGGAPSNSYMISDGVTNVTLLTQESPPTRYDTIRTVIDKTNGSVFVETNGGGLGAPINISTLGSWFIKFYAPTTGATQGGQISVYFTGYLDGTTGSVDLIMKSKDFGVNKTAGIVTWDSDAADNTIQGYISSNSGTNFNTLNKDRWTTIGTVGSIGQIKLACTLPTSINGSALNMKRIKGYGGYFDG